MVLRLFISKSSTLIIMTIMIDYWYILLLCSYIYILGLLVICSVRDYAEESTETNYGLHFKNLKCLLKSIYKVILINFSDSSEVSSLNHASSSLTGPSCSSNEPCSSSTQPSSSR